MSDYTAAEEAALEEEVHQHTGEVRVTEGATGEAAAQVEAAEISPSSDAETAQVHQIRQAARPHRPHQHRRVPAANSPAPACAARARGDVSDGCPDGPGGPQTVDREVGRLLAQTGPAALYEPQAARGRRPRLRAPLHLGLPRRRIDDRIHDGLAEPRTSCSRGRSGRSRWSAAPRRCRRSIGIGCPSRPSNPAHTPPRPSWTTSRSAAASVRVSILRLTAGIR